MKKIEETCTLDRISVKLAKAVSYETDNELSKQNALDYTDTVIDNV